ncbi:MAG TPA: glycerophosphodiester phosphodiesterase [Noviherbaspirillum sp.]|nr:glycerophosphodiester phosphodiesterase [Noviherbaspirillum sp.]
MWLYPRIVAHRGGGTLAPENTLAALRCGLAHGYRAVEFDVMLSSDGVPILMHDPEFGRTVPGRGIVGELPAARLMALDAGSWFSPSFAGEPVPSFEQAARFCKENGIWMNVEIKPVPGYEAATGKAVAEWTARLFPAEFADADRAALPLLSSFSPEALMAARQAAPKLPRALLVKSIPADWLARLRVLGAIALHVDHTRLTERRARAVKQHGFGLFCYTVNSPGRARELLDWGVDAFCTDRIDLISPDPARL